MWFIDWIKEEAEAVGYILLGLFMLVCVNLILDAWQGFWSRVWGTNESRVPDEE